MKQATLAQPAPAFAIPLANAARAKRLTIVVGAGVSYARPTALPDGKDLAKRLHESLTRLVTGYECDPANAENLPAVAQAGEDVLGGRRAVQALVPTLADFETAAPTIAHSVFSMLAAEGAISLITTNWDSCLERGSDPPLPAFYKLDDVDDSISPHVFKIHGTANIPTSLILSEEQLGDPFIEAGDYVASHLMSSTVVFVGIGDIAPYVQEPLEMLTHYINSGHVYVVSPSIFSNWEHSNWSKVLPELGDEFKIGEDADTFAQNLAHGWLMRLIEAVTILLDGDRQAIAALGSLCEGCTCSHFLTWIRSVRVAWPLGVPVVMSEAAKLVLVAICKIAAGKAVESGTVPLLSTSRNSAIVIDDQEIHVAVFHEPKRSEDIQRRL